VGDDLFDSKLILCFSHNAARAHKAQRGKNWLTVALVRDSPLVAAVGSPGRAGARCGSLRRTAVPPSWRGKKWPLTCGSNGIKALLAELGVVDDRTDEEIVADEGDEKREPIAIIPRDTWCEHVVPVRGRRLALLKEPFRRWSDGAGSKCKRCACFGLSRARVCSHGCTLRGRRVVMQRCVR
jgi:hypothetical protein